MSHFKSPGRSAATSKIRYEGSNGFLGGRDFPSTPTATKTLIYRHLAWLTVLRYSLRSNGKVWESVSNLANAEVWLAMPFSILISWIYVSLERVGESTENPFEGGTNDVPIAQISRTIEIELREMLRETELPPPLLPQNQIIL